MDYPDRDYPRLQISLDASKFTLLQAFENRNQEIQRVISDSFDKALVHVIDQVDAQVMKALATVMEHAINRAAEQASEELADKIAEAMSQQVHDMVKKAMMPK